MRTINERLPYGYITPPHQGAGFDRPAYYSQVIDGREVFFDAHAREIIPGQSGTASVPTPAPAREVERQYSPAELIANVGQIPWSAWEKEAKRVLGPTAPAGRDALVSALQAAINAYAEKQQKRGGRKPQAAAGPADPPEMAAAPLSAPEPTVDAPRPPGGGVDLAAWARGDKGHTYRMPEIRKAIRDKFSRQVSGPNERYDALLVCVDEKLITKAQMRKDIQPIGGE
jgi:hypothetical protein